MAEHIVDVSEPDRAREQQVAAFYTGVYREFVQKPGVGTRDEGERRLPVAWNAIAGA